ncbi:heparin lyase I family protein [Variovorax sp. J22G21]|uniref:heparin lyase I family protein n=1 Tax=Variovorax fucosicus TaxID=3053517 RepID=UPI002577BCE9|nr:MULTISPECIES: heparin lyase I family protein [unclassified Variovorax]MDM0039785.1 heparin lyase I family protein [Variovorax sp. J22R193]MDM0064666.1 heparin lyase I family protein [Variovorax sp. J22G21]
MPHLPWPHGWTHHFEASHSVNADHSYTLSIEERPLGVECASQRFEVRKGEVGHMDTVEEREDDNIPRARAEMAQHGDLQDEGDIYWYAWSFFVPADFPDSVSRGSEAWPYVTLTQFMQQKGESGKFKPAFVFAKVRDRFILRHFPKDFRVGYDRSWPLISHSDFPGKWHDLVVHIKWTRGNSGFLQVWVDGESDPVIDETSLQTMNVGSGPVYHKYGVYRIDDPSLPPGIVFFSQLRRGKTRAEVESP